jgi:hypothetical protein
MTEHPRQWETLEQGAIEIALQQMTYSNHPSSQQDQGTDLHLLESHQLIAEKNRALEHMLLGGPPSLSILSHACRPPWMMNKSLGEISTNDGR